MYKYVRKQKKLVAGLFQFNADDLHLIKKKKTGGKDTLTVIIKNIF